MKKVSVVMPCEVERIPLLLESMKAYEAFDIPEEFEFIIVSRTIKPNQLPFKHRLITYKWTKTPAFFNPSLALNLGVKASKYNNVIITCPEVKPFSNCLKQLEELPRGNYVCQVFDMDKSKKRIMSLVNTKFRFEHPGFYFLALYKKEDIEAINGWDLNFMYGFAWDDNDFGERFVRARLQFEIRDEIQAEHQYHPRVKNFTSNWTPKHLAYNENIARVNEHRLGKIAVVSPGLKEVEKWQNEN